MPEPVVLSYVQLQPLWRARQVGGSTALVSPDLGLSTVQVAVSGVGVVFPTGESLTWEQLEHISESETKCFLVEGNEVREIRVFSEATSRVCSLMPTEGAPTMVIGGFPMHRIKGTDPYRDTRAKIKAAAPVVGRVLDTTTGLGYTAIEAAKTATTVLTIELDPGALEIARLNPWSRALFNNPRITQRVGDSSEEVQALESNYFSRIIHDPPIFSLAGDLYSGEFYRHLYRVLTRGGRLFHYIGNPDSASGGRVTKGVARRLQEAGFSRVQTRSDAFGLVACK